jgi:hypothetical protein
MLLLDVGKQGRIAKVGLAAGALIISRFDCNAEIFFKIILSMHEWCL